MVKDLPRIRQAIFGSDELMWSALHRQFMWTLVVVMLASCMRLSTAIEYSPKVTSIKTPTSLEEWDVDGHPKWLTFEIHKWKGKKATDPTQTFRLYRNYVNPAFCPVIAVIFWLASSGLGNFMEHDDVLLFPSFTDSFHALTGSTHNNTNMVRAWLYEVFALVDLRECTPHSLRRTAAQWAAQCYGEEWQIRIGGRWGLSGTSFRLYIEEGASIRDDFHGRGLEDPIFKLWVWHYGVVNRRSARPHGAP